MLGLVGRSGWELEMGSARRCLAAAARQLKVNMKKIQINTLYNWKPMEFRGKKGEGVIECSRFLPDLLLLFAFVGVFSLLIPKTNLLFNPPSLWLFQQIQFSRRKASPIKYSLIIFFHDTALSLITQL